MDRLESPDINPSIYGQYAIKEPRIYTAEMRASSTTGVGKIGQLHARE